MQTGTASPGMEVLLLEGSASSALLGASHRKQTDVCSGSDFSRGAAKCGYFCGTSGVRSQQLTSSQPALVGEPLGCVYP